MSHSGRAGKIAYGMCFTVVLPLGLWIWNSRLSCSLPAVRSLWGGLALCGLGVLLMLQGMWGLWREGGGLPMNAFPPPRVATRGAYSLVPHPIYFGFVAMCGGVSLLANSASALWIVTPIVALSCLSLVLGYEGPDLRRRFGSQLPVPWLGIPPGEGALSVSRRAGAALAVLLPWIACAWAVKLIGIPPGAFDTRSGWESAIPVVPATVPVYSSIYLACPLAFLLCGDRAEMRRLVISGWMLTALMGLLYLSVPAFTVIRTLPVHGWLGEWLAWEQRLDVALAGVFPSSSAAWGVICAVFLARGSLGRVPVLAWLWCLGICVSCLTTGTHSLVSVLAGMLAGSLCAWPDKLWRLILLATEQLGNSWKAWQLGPLRVMNHGLWAGSAGFIVLFIAGAAAGSENLGWILLVAVCALIGAALWAQWVEGSSALLRPFGYYGAMLGGLLAIVGIAMMRGPVASLIAAFALAAPWTQAIGRLRCVVQGCCHGRPVEWGIRVTNPHSRVVKLAGFSGRPIHPAPLYSILANIVAGLFLLRLWLGGTGPYVIAGLYLVLAGLSRFAEEAYRGEPQTIRYAGLPLYQWMAVGSVILGMVVMILPGSPLPPLSASAPGLWASSLLWAMISAFAMSMDFPASTRRFSRLTG